MDSVSRLGPKFRSTQLSEADISDPDRFVDPLHHGDAEQPSTFMETAMDIQNLSQTTTEQPDGTDTLEIRELTLAELDEIGGGYITSHSTGGGSQGVPSQG